MRSDTFVTVKGLHHALTLNHAKPVVPSPPQRTCDGGTHPARTPVRLALRAALLIVGLLAAMTPPATKAGIVNYSSTITAPAAPANTSFTDIIVTYSYDNMNMITNLKLTMPAAKVH